MFLVNESMTESMVVAKYLYLLHGN